MNTFKYSKTDLQSFIYDIFFVGIKDGFKSSVNIIKIMIPVSLIITILKYLGLVEILSKFLTPMCSLLGLQGEAILVLLSGYLINCYSAIAVMATLSLTLKQITILSSMLLLCHTLPLELSIQKKAGSPLWLILFIRVSSSLFVGFILNYIIPYDSNFVIVNFHTTADIINKSFFSMILEWLFDNLIIIKIIVINILITIFYKTLNRFNIIEKVRNLFKYVMLIFGLPEEVTVLWLIINIIGLVFGASMLIETKNNNSIDDISLKKLNISVSVCHSLIQESANFLALGVSLFFLIVPRLIISIAIIWIYNLILFLKPKSNKGF